MTTAGSAASVVTAIRHGEGRRHMTRVLVATASKHGATDEIGEAIAEALAARGLEAISQPVAAVTTLDGIDAVVLGSAVYAGRWMGEAKAFADRFESELQRRPVWLFSSGPLGDPALPAEDPMDAEPMLRRTGARDHRVFAGRLEKAKLGPAERLVISAVHAPYGDYRDWAAVTAWAGEIATVVTAPTAGAVATAVETAGAGLGRIGT
jgi:menaquinone-dependent protoporphyrinogen oxidase